MVFSKESYRTDIKLGEKYRDDQTGLEGIATAVIFYQFGCERVDIETVVAGEIKAYSFDAPRLTHVNTQHKVETPRNGGPDKASTSLRR